MAFSRQRELRAPPSGGGIIDAMGDLDWEGSSADGLEEDEVLARNEGSEQDRRFDLIVGELEEAVMDPAFTTVQQAFVNEWCGEFDDTEENKLVYTDLFRQHTQLVEQHLEGWLRQRIKGFDMEAFMKTVAEREDEIVGDVIDVLVALTDFQEFKDMMVAHRKGRDNGLAAAVVVASIEPRGHATRDGARGYSTSDSARDHATSDDACGHAASDKARSHATRDEGGPSPAGAAGAAISVSAADLRARRQQQLSSGCVGGAASAMETLSVGGKAREGKGVGESKG